MALQHDACKQMRERASKKVVNYFLEVGLLSETPAL
jgi:hypothetical protein